jgi:hypothetical protein
MKAVLSALAPAPVAVDAIARQTGLNVQAVQVALLELDLAGRIERQGYSLVALKGVLAAPAMRFTHSLRVRNGEHAGELAAPLLLRHPLQLAQQIGEIF